MTNSSDWGQLALDIQVAAHTRAPVLISAPAPCAENVARAIAAFSSAWTPPELVVCNCAEGVNLTAVVDGALARGADPDRITLLLREVHALGEADQAAIARVVGEPGSGRPAGAPRIISTSSVSLFDQVRKGAFDERLFYRLNVVHIVVREKKSDRPDAA
jgi:transcriptional regulator of acetoin/glycerol metabolism